MTHLTANEKFGFRLRSRDERCAPHGWAPALAHPRMDGHHTGRLRTVSDATYSVNTRNYTAQWETQGGKRGER